MRAGHIRNILLWGDGHIYSRTAYADMRCNLRIPFGVVPVPVNYNSSGIVGLNRHSKIDFIVNFRIIYVVLYSKAASLILGIITRFQAGICRKSRERVHWFAARATCYDKRLRVCLKPYDLGKKVKNTTCT